MLSFRLTYSFFLQEIGGGEDYIKR
jgi:hypothetical protein